MSDQANDYGQHVPAADRALTLLEILASSDDGVTTPVLLDMVGGSRSGLYALLNTLRARGYVETEDGVHRAGEALWSLVPSPPVALEALVDHFRVEASDSACPETVALVWPEGEGTVVVSEAPSDQTVRVGYGIGTQRSPASVDALVMSAGDPRPNEVTEAIRTDGYGISESDEVVELAAPICRDGMRPTAALLIGIPTQRADGERREEALSWLRRAAARLSHRIGASAYQPYGWSAGQTVDPSSEMSQADLDEFLTGLWSAQLACVKADGTPHVVPLWYEWDGSTVWLTGSPGASWRRHIAVEPHVSLTLDEPWPPLRRVFIAGVAEEVEDADVPGGLVGLRSRLATRYLGRGADDQPELVQTEGWSAVRVVPERIHGRMGLGAIPGGAS